MINKINNLDHATETILEQISVKLDELLSAVGLNVTVAEREIHNNLVYFNLEGEDSFRFLDHKAEPLKSMAFLLQTWLDHDSPNNGVHVMIDAKGELRKREEELSRMVEEACAQLTQVGQEAKLDSLNPYDRRVVYLLLEDQHQFSSESQGHGHFKTIVIRRIS